MISENLQAVRKLIKQREAYNERNVCISKIKEMEKSFESYKGKYVDGKIIQETWDYYEELTNGDVPTRAVVSDIDATFRRLVIL